MSEYAPIAEPEENVSPTPTPDTRGGELVEDPRKTNVFVVIGISIVVLAGIVGLYLYLSSSFRKTIEKPVDTTQEEEVAEVIEVPEKTVSESSPFGTIEEEEPVEVSIKELSASFGDDVTPEDKLKKYLSAKTGHFDIFSEIVSGETIVKADYSPDSNAVALITRVDEDIPKNRAYVYFYDSPTTVNLFEQEIVPVDFINDPNRVYTINDIAFSKDGSKLSFVTNYMILSYDIDSNHLTLLLDAEESAVEQNNINFFHYFSPMYSEDNTMLAVGKSYFEGSAAFVLDIANNEIVNLPFFNYTSGEYVNGWLGNKLLVQRHGVEDSVRPNGLFLTTPRDPETEETIYSSDSMPFYKAAVTESAVYTFFGNVLRYDRNTGEITQILSVPDLWPQYLDETNRLWEMLTDYNNDLYLRFMVDNAFDVYRIDIEGDLVTLRKVLL